jgi:hypothetical protein
VQMVKCRDEFARGQVATSAEDDNRAWIGVFTIVARGAAVILSILIHCETMADGWGKFNG